MQRILAMILAGGRVDELSVLTLYRPKSAVPFGGLYRVIDCALSNLMHSGVEQAGILSQYRSYSLINHIAQGAPWDMTGRDRGVTILPPFQAHRASDWYKGTADAVYQNLNFIDFHRPDLVMVLSGDHIYRMDYRPMIEYHLKKKADMTAAFVEVDPKQGSRFGMAQMEGDGRYGGKIVSYKEKPLETDMRWASMTVYIFRTQVLREVLEGNAKSDSHEFGRDIIPGMLKNYGVFGYKFNGYWNYSRKIDEYWQANMDVIGSKPKISLAKWMLRTNLDHRSIRDRQPAVIGKEAVIRNCVFYHGSIINGYVENSVIFPGVQIEKNAVVKNSVLLFDTRIEKGAFLDKVICDTDVVIADGATIGKPKEAPFPRPVTVIGRSTAVPSQLVIGQGCTVYPDLKPADFKQPEVMPGESVQ